MKKTMILAALCMTMAANATTKKEMTMPTTTSGFETMAYEMTGKKTITKAEARELTKKLKHFVSEKEKAFIVHQTYMELTEADDCDCNDMQTLQMVWEEKFINFLSDNPLTLDYPEKEMEKILGTGYKVATSPDGRLRTYSWYTDRGGSWVNFCSVMQYRTEDGYTYVTWECETTEEEDFDEDEETYEDEEDEEYENSVGWEWQSYVTKIHEMDTADGRIYMLQDYVVVSGVSGYQSIEALAITKDDLTLMPIFMVDGKKKSYLMYETFGNDTTDDRFLTYDRKNKSIVIHQYEEDGDEPLYGKDEVNWAKEDIVFTFDGKMFNEK